MKFGHRILLVGLGGIILMIAGFQLFKPQIGQAVFQRAVNQTVGRDRTADLPDGLHVYVCGAGSPIPDPVRSGSCLGVVAGKRAFVFDIGSGGVRTLLRMGFPVQRLERVYLTHLHSDHFDGLGELMLQAWVGGTRRTPLPVSGPAGTDQIVAGFTSAYQIDSGFRTAHHGSDIADPSGFGGYAEVIMPHNPTDKTILLLDEPNLKISAFLVNHMPVSPAFGYRINYKGRSVVISGDTTYDTNLVSAAQGVDILFHEALEPGMVKAMQQAATANGQSALAKILDDIPDYHASPADAARAAREAGARELFLYHIVPPLPLQMLEAAFLNDVGDRFSGPVTIVSDGLMVSLPANGKKIETHNVF